MAARPGRPFHLEDAFVPFLDDLEGLFERVFRQRLNFHFPLGIGRHVIFEGGRRVVVVQPNRDGNTGHIRHFLVRRMVVDHAFGESSEAAFQL